MTSRVSFRWLLALLALMTPASLLCHRSVDARDDAASAQLASDEVLFRHFV